MEQGARAPGKPGVNGRVFPGGWLACFSAVALGASVSIAVAGGTAIGALASDKARSELVLKLMSAEDVATKFSFVSFKSDTLVLKVPTRAVHRKAAYSSIESFAPAPEKGVQKRRSTILFGSLGKPVSMSPVTERWARALEDIQTGSQFSYQHVPAFETILSNVSAKRRGLQIPKVNALVNRMLSYQEDDQLWQTSEYWASPAETLSKRAGDCEDYAILKYALLRELGIKDEDMRIVVLRDKAVRQYHAVLTVRHKNKWLVLDNRFSRVRFERDLPHYQALYSVNASGEWSHTPTGNTPVRLAARLKSAMK